MNPTRSTSRQKFWTSYLLPVLWAAFIFILSNQTSLPGFELSAADFVLKKSAHMFVYGVLFILVHRALNTAGFGRKGMPVWAMAFAITIIYAVSDELHQTFVAGRYGSAKDVGYDALGAYVAILLKYKYI